MDDRPTEGGHWGPWGDCSSARPSSASLRQYAEEARGRDGRLVLVSGEAGIGKSSLLEELQSGLRDATWVWGACDGLFTPRPLAPFHDIAREVGGDARTTPSREGASRDAGLRRGPDLARRPRTGCIVLVVEDVQWADDATLDLLRFLGRRLRSLPVLLLVTFRDDALAPADTLRIALGELGGQRSTRRIDLPRLSPDGVRRLAAGTAAPPRGAPPAHRWQPVLPHRGARRRRGRDPVLGARRRAGPGRLLDDDARTSPRGRGPRRSPRGARAGRRRRPVRRWRPSTGSSTRGCSPPTATPCASGTSCRGAPSSPAIPPHRRTAGHRALLDALVARACDDDDARLAYHAEGAGDAALVQRLRPARRAAGGGAGCLPRGSRPVRARPALPTGRPAGPRRAVRRVRRPARPGRPLAAGRRGARSARSASGRARGRPARGPRPAQAVLGDVAAVPGPGVRGSRGRGRSSSSSRSATTPSSPGCTRSTPSRSGRPTRTPRPEMLARAQRMAESIGEPDVLSDVLNNVAFGAFARREDWVPAMREALRIALETGLRAPRPGAPTPTPTPSTPPSTASPRPSGSTATASPTATTATSRRTAPACVATGPSR